MVKVMSETEWKMVNVKPQTLKKLETLGLYFGEDRAVLIDALVSALLSALSDALSIEQQSGASIAELLHQKYTVGIIRDGIAQKLYAIKQPIVGSYSEPMSRDERTAKSVLTKRVKKHFDTFEGKTTKKQTVAKLKMKVSKK